MDQEEPARCLEAPDGLSRVRQEFRRGSTGAGGCRRRIRGTRCASPRGTSEEVETRYRAGLAIAKRSAARLKDAPPFTEDDLYDENGLPA
jgi:hypothetical protein